ncbi:START domain protein [Cooperia oncophora]
MSTTVKLLEIEDTTSDSQYGMGLRNTAHAFVEALEVFDDAKRADRKDWKEKAEHKGDKCFNKHFPIGKVYYLKKLYNVDAETMFKHHWNRENAGMEWKCAECGTYCYDQRDGRYYSHYTTSDSIGIKGRDFVVCRMWRKVGDSYVVAATSFETDIPVAAKKKRGWANVVAGKFAPLANDPSKCTIEYLVSVDLKDKVTPKAPLIAETMIKDARYAFKIVEKDLVKKKPE